MEIFKEINATGITVIIVTHENEIASNTRRIIRLKDGMIEHDNMTPDMLHQQQNTLYIPQPN